MADKEATVYIVDVGRSMGEKNGGRECSDLDWAMLYVWDKITTTVATGRKTATIGVVGLRTDGKTSNDVWTKSKDEAYEHISIFKEIGQALMPDLRELRSLIKTSSTDNGDAISSIALAVDIIVKYCKKLKYKRKIVLVTNGKGRMDPDGMNRIAGKINEEGIELVILGVDFDDPEFGIKEEDKDAVKAENESSLQKLCDTCDGVYGTLEQAISELDTPRVKVVRGIPSFKGNFKLGDPENYDSALTIQVERYYRTYAARPPPASSFVLSGAPPEVQETGDSSATLNNASTEAEKSTSNELTVVRNARSYQVADSGVVGGKRDVERDALAKGYEYGRTAVHITESDENITKLETKAALEIIGFIPTQNYDRYMNMSNSNVIVAQRTNNKAIMALSSIIRALFELESYAVGRLVSKDGKSPTLILLAPSIDPDYECLLEVQLPFAEDVRCYRFPPLDRVTTVSGKVVKEHRNLPNESLLAVMEKYVESMELVGSNDESDQAESFALEDCYSPLLHRIDQAIRWRAIHPTKLLPEVPEVLQKLSRQPEELKEKSKPVLEQLIKASDVKKVPPKMKGRKRNRDADKPLSGLDVDALLQGEKRQKISPENAIPEFKQALANTDDINTVKDSVKQMCAIVENQIKHSLGDANYDRAVEYLGTMRDELISFEEPELYNDFVRELKRKLLDDKLGEDRRELWWLIRKNRIGLIDDKLVEISKVTEQEAKELAE
ncbi:Ku80 [Nannizzia gypsea CBS 118893]|uniref:ATP-dependent DNA helicase II subunit 2 n=1 Tax=Arthroderma gypseum (strain ATCC MYA-4604 / CBS 118893) TaxID=535722 RepID=E5R048_ARTGP|nr:Ku80 [Nannizzia gypsea CBS 118893]EFQ97459.1 Ku80 [Nannizzia gypsea CBS 118893]